MIIYILYYLVFKILSSFVRDSSYHDMYYKGSGLLCAHKKSFNTAIPVGSLGPYMYVHYCTCIVHILVLTYLFLLTSFFDCLFFCGLFLKHPKIKIFSFLYSLFLPIEISLSLSLCVSLSVFLSVFLSLFLSLSLSLSLSLCLSPCISIRFIYLCMSSSVSLYSRP